MFGIWSFIKNKIAELSLRDLLNMELEAWFSTLLGIVPGFFGILIRYPFYKIMFNRIDGLPIIQRGVTIVHMKRIRIGKYFGANTGTYINGLGGITIGNYVLLGNNVTISSGKHPIDGVEPPIFSRPSIPQPISIEDDVWVGANAVILPGITLSKGTVIAANAVVTRSTEKYSVMVGAPARLIRYRVPNINDLDLI